MFQIHVLHRESVGRVQIHEFQNLVQVMFRPIFRTDNKYVECIYTNLITRSESCLQALFVTDGLYVKRQSTTSFSCSKSCL